MGWPTHAAPGFGNRRQEAQDFQDYRHLYSKFKSCLGYIRICLKKTKNKFKPMLDTVEKTGGCTLSCTSVTPHEP